jgi:glycosyltransferase involved in cell wall biosynthesis
MMQTQEQPAPLVSVLVTVYNRETYLRECLESVLASTWTDFELIVVDDASTDGSWQVAESIALADARVRLFRNDNNLGDYGNRMRAARLARGEYIKYLDSDDIIYSHSLALMVEAMRKYPDAALGLSHSDPEGEEPYPWLLAPDEVWKKEFLGGGALGCGPSGTIIRRDAFFEIGGFGNWGVLNDTDLWYRLSARWAVVLLPPGLVWWRRHPGQEFTRNDADLAYLANGLQMSLGVLSMSDNPLSPDQRMAAESRARQRHARRLWSLALRRGRVGTAFGLMRESRLSAADILSGLRPYR